ncbi:hypothetical protein TIFTF001_012871 [Ficus carica]|uniref:Uncharacterized protein n=1 Tax=Ficus carica TaxID=3494 RepID=A0AA87ZTZ3_FICCA|nr:hypothetical protein TIFTF001_012871 [Ficus carica]
MDSMISRSEFRPHLVTFERLPRQKNGKRWDLQMARSGGSGGEAHRKPICRGAMIQRL